MKKSMNTLAVIIGLTAATALAATSANADTFRRGDGHDRGRNRADVVLFEHANFNGARIAVDGAIPNLNQYRFNDRVSSINVREGKWLVCTDAYFRGRCEVIRNDIRQTGFMRLNDNISSIRPFDARRDRNMVWNDRDDHNGRYDKRDYDRNRGEAAPASPQRSPVAQAKPPVSPKPPVVVARNDQKPDPRGNQKPAPVEQKKDGRR